MKTISFSKSVAAAAILGGSLSLFAQVNLPIGNLAPGETVTLTFDVTLTNQFPAGVSSVTNQGTLSGNNFSTLNSDDPSTAPIGDATVTTVFIAPVITSATNTTFLVGSNTTFTVTKTGNPAPDLSVSGTIPQNLSFNPGTGSLSGVPSIGKGGIYPLVFTATNITGTNVQNFTLTVDEAASINSVNHTTFLVGSNSTFNVTAGGFPAPTFTETGALPGGVTLAADGTLAGTPAAGMGRIYPITLTASNNVGTPATQSFTLTVNETPSITCPADTATNATGGVCVLPSITFASTVNAGFPSPTVTYTLGASVIASPYVFPIGTNTVTSTATNSVGTNSCSFMVTVAAGAAPQLTILGSGTNVLISWPSLFSCYTLQLVTDLSSNLWSNYPGPFTTNGGNILVTNAVGPTNRFFRLSD